MELVVADDERDAVEHPLRVEDRFMVHAGHVVEIDNNAKLVKELKQCDSSMFLSLAVLATFERFGFFHEAHNGNLR